ncbi:magnesium transporter [Candidatus Microgenomates bacterium]|nr:magnesium transporter [Candidatus Microgenomates bacterium]
MIYFSELKNKKVFTEDNVFVGRLRDLVFRASENPLITKVLIVSQSKEQMMIPVDYLKKMHGDYGDVILRKHYELQALSDDEMFVGKNLLDNQIIDIAGDKMVRVNDVAIQEKPEYILAGVDIGVLGILRWFGLEDRANKILAAFKVNLTSRFLSWADIQTLELTRGHVKIKKEQTKLDKIRPEDLADYLEQTNVSNISSIIKMLDVQRAADVINNLNLNYQIELFKQFSIEEAAKIVKHMDAEESADVLASLTKSRRAKIMELIDEKSRKEIEYLLHLSKSPVGDIITTEYTTVNPHQSVREVIDQIRQVTREFNDMHYVYVLNKDEQLVGVFSLHELLLQQLDAQVYKFMNPNVTVVYLSTPESVVLRKLLKYKLYALPVIDSERHIIGLVTFDDVSELIHNIR